MSTIENSLARLGSLDNLAARDTPAGRLDPRVKVCATVAFVAVVASFGRLDLEQLIPLALFPVALAALGDVPWRPVLVRLAIASPFALLVAAFEPIFDRAPAASIGPYTLSGGELAFLVILTKFGLSLSAGLLLVATTGFDSVCVALGRLGVPRVLVSQLSLTYRYLFVLGDEAGRMLRAHALRAPDHPRPTLKMVGLLIGQLLLRATARAERVHIAMRARGFDGRLPVRRRWTFSRRDGLFVLGVTLFLVVTRAVDVPGALGSAAWGVLR